MSQRWVAALSSYTFSIKYRSGKHNTDADALSRLPALLKEQHILSPESVGAIYEGTNLSPLVDTISTNTSFDELLSTSNVTNDLDWNSRQNDDDTLRVWKAYVSKGWKPMMEDINSEHHPLSLVTNFKKLILENNILYRKVTINGEEYKQLVVPRSYIDTIMVHLHHQFGHNTFISP